MKARSVLRAFPSLLGLSTCALLTAGVMGCVTEEQTQGGCTEEPLYAGAATDEAWRSLIDARARAVADDPNSASVVVPGADQNFKASDPAPTFTWTSGLKVALAPRVDVPGHKRPERSLFDALTSLVIPSALAHLAPVTSDVHLLEIAIPGRTCPWGILTTNLDYPVDDVTWSTLKAAADQPLSLTITSAYLTENRVTEGPFTSTARTFVVTP